MLDTYIYVIFISMDIPSVYEFIVEKTTRKLRELLFQTEIKFWTNIFNVYTQTVHMIETRPTVTTGPWCADQEKRQKKSLLSYIQIMRTFRSSFKSVSTKARLVGFREITCFDIRRGFGHESRTRYSSVGRKDYIVRFAKTKIVNMVLCRHRSRYGVYGRNGEIN